MALAGWEWARLNDAGALAVRARRRPRRRLRAGALRRLGDDGAARSPGGSRSRSGCSAAPGCCAPASPAGRALPRPAALGHRPGRALDRVARPRQRQGDRPQLHPLGLLPRLGRRHVRLFRRPRLRQAKARAGDQPRQELGRRVERHGGALAGRGGLAVDRRRRRSIGRKLLHDRRQPLRPASAWRWSSSSWSR